MNEDGEEWKNSKQKKDIIAAFLDDESGIQRMSPAQIFDTYADGVVTGIVTIIISNIMQVTSSSL